MLVGRPDTKSWWRNFGDQDGHTVDLLVRGHWQRLTGRVVTTETDAARCETLLATYLDQFPVAARALDGASLKERAQGCVLVWCS